MGRFHGETSVFQGDSGVIQSASVPIQGVSPPDPSVSNRFTAASNGPQWYEFEAATPINQSHKGLRVAGFLAIVSGVVVLMYMGEDLRAQIISILACSLYILTVDPFAAIGSILARASRVILASAICMIGTVIIIPVPGLIVACCLWGMTAVTAVKKFNHRYLMQDTFSSARAIPDAIRTAPESKAGNAWRHSGAKLANALAAELGATCRDYAEVKARELTFYIGYQMADTKMDELTRKCERLRLENTLLKDAEAEKNDLLKQIAEQDARNRKAREQANTERQQLLRKIRELEDTNAELVRAVPEEVQMISDDDVESKLEYAFKTLHLTDSKAAEYAGCAQAKAWRYRKDNGIEPRGGKT